MTRRSHLPHYRPGTVLVGRERIPRADLRRRIQDDVTLLTRCKISALVEMAYWQGMMHADGRRTPRIPRREIEDADNPGRILSLIYDFRREAKRDPGFSHADQYHRDRRDCSERHPHGQPRDDDWHDTFHHIQHLLQLARRWSVGHLCQYHHTGIQYPVDHPIIDLP